MSVDADLSSLALCVVQAAEARIDLHLCEANGTNKALQAAIEALELLMQACAQAASHERKKQLKTKLNKLMARAEEIKKIKSQEQMGSTREQLNGAQAAMARVSLSSQGRKIRFLQFMPL